MTKKEGPKQEVSKQVSEDRKTADAQSKIEKTAKPNATEPVEAKKNEHLSFTDTLPQLKKYRRTKLWRRLSLIIGILIIPLLITVYYVSPLSLLNQVSVKGNQTIASEKIITDSKFHYGEDFLSQYFDRKQAVAAIKKENVRIHTVSITPSGFNTLQISVTEYGQIAQLSKGKQYYPILENGKTLDQGTKTPESGFVILEDFKADDAIIATIKAYEKLPDDIRSAISQINATPTKANDSLLKLMMKDGNTVIVNIENLAQQMIYYPKVAKDLPDTGIIDMEVGIFYTPYTSETKESDASESTTTTTSESNEETKTPESSESVTNPQ